MSEIQSLPPLSKVVPVPLAWAVHNQIAPNGHKFVILRVETPVGSTVFLMTPENAKDLSADLSESATGISVAKPAEVTKLVKP